MPHTHIQRFHYHADYADVQDLSEQSVLDKEVASGLLSEDKGTVWLHVTGTHHVDVIKAICQAFGLHHLVADAILEEDQRPHIEAIDDGLLVLTQVLTMEAEEIRAHQLAIVLLKGTLLTFQADALPVPLWEPLEKRVIEGKGRVRKRGADYLMYALLDAIVEHHIGLVDDLEEEAESHEEALLGQGDEGAVQSIYRMRIKLTNLRQRTRPHRELLKALAEEETTLLEDRTRPYLRDVHSRSLRIADGVETLREMLSGMIDLHSTQVNQRMNEIMKFLTMMSATFVPLNLIAAIYGMNFKNMPELGISWMYFAVWGLMLAIVGGMLYLYKKKDWL